jgi:type I restriction enzyme S subunit
VTGLPKGWAEVTLDEVNDPNRPICYGILKPGPDLEDGVPYVKVKHFRDERIDLESLHRTSTEIDDKYKRSRLVGGDLLVSIRGTYGRVAPVPDELAGGNITQDSARIAPVGVRASYIQKYLQGPAAQTFFAEVARGVAVKGVNIRDLRQTPVGVPPLAEQDRIVAAIEEAFSKLDAGEAGLRTVRQLLKRMRDAILAAAVTGRLVPRDPTDTPATKLLADLGIEALDQGDLDDLPDGWARVALGDLAEVISGPAFKSAQFKGPGEGTRLLRGENIEPGALRWRDTRTWPDDLLPGHEHLLVAASDLILAMDRPVISTGLKLAPVRAGDLPALLVQRVARIRPKTDELRLFLLVAMQHSRFVAHLLGGQVGTQLPHITLKGIRDYAVGLPGQEETQRIVGEVERQLSFVDACERAVDAGLERSAALRRSVLKDAFEGRLVPQDPTDEPASVLLERIRAERAAAPKAKTRRAKAKS